MSKPDAWMFDFPNRDGTYTTHVSIERPVPVGRVHIKSLVSSDKLVELERLVEMCKDVLLLIKRDARHDIPSYAFGDNEAACHMDKLLENLEGYGDETLAAIERRQGGKS